MMATFYASVPILPIYCQQNGITGSKISIVLTAMSLTTVLFRPFAGYILDNFNRYYVYMLFLALFCLPFLGFVVFPFFGALVVIRLYMGAVYSFICLDSNCPNLRVLLQNRVSEGKTEEICSGRCIL